MKVQDSHYIKEFNWCGFDWICSMEGGRLIHPSYPHQWYDGDCVNLIEDTLELSIKRHSNTIHHWDGFTYYPQIGVGTIMSKQSFSIGKFSALIQLPEGHNLWPSFWLTGVESWPPEIDICEAWSNKRGSYFRMFIPQFPYLSPSWKTTTNFHYGDSEETHKWAGTRNISIFKQCHNPSNNLIEYAVERHYNLLIYKVNGKTVRTIDNVEHKLGLKSMVVIFNIWTENMDFTYQSPMLIREFKFESYL